MLIYGIIETTREKPVQDKLKNEILSERMEYDLKKKLFNNPINNDVTSGDLEKLKNSFTKKETKLKNLQKNAITHRKQRVKKKAVMQELIESNPDAAKILKPINRPASGRPRLEETQDGLLSAIYQLVVSQTSADNRQK